VFSFALFANVSVLQTRAGTPEDVAKTVPRSVWKREKIPEVSRRFSEESRMWFRSEGRVLKEYDNTFDDAEGDRIECPYVLPDIAPSESWHDNNSGLTIHRPEKWAPSDNTTYLYVAPNSFLAQSSAVSEHFSEDGKRIFSFVVPLKSIHSSKVLSRKDDLLVDVRCRIEEVSIIPENAQLPNGK